MFISIDNILGLLLHFEYLVLFPAVVVEGPIVTIISGFLSSLGYLNIFFVFPVVVLADLTGDILWYSMGRWGREVFIEKWGRYVGITLARVEKLEEHFNKHMGKALFLGKLSHGLGGIFLVAAGISKIPIGKFIWFNFLATLPKTLVLLIIGYYFGEAFIQLNRYINYVAIAFASMGILLPFLYYVGVDKLVNKVLKGQW